MKRSIAIVMAFALSVSLVTTGASASSRANDQYDNECVGVVEPGGVGKCTTDLREVRAATAKYIDYRVALNDGFIPVSHCVTSAEEHGTLEGTMGIHHLNPSRNDEHIKLREPEILLYVPDQTLGMRLVAIEYSVAALVDGKQHYGPLPPQSGTFDPPPELFGRAFDGPMAGHNPVQPWHHDLHVWAWSDNPSGLFSHFNPDEDCLP